MWVVAALASLAALTILVLCVPLDIRLHLDVPGKPKIRLTWLFGVVSKEVTQGKKKTEEKKKVVRKKPGGRRLQARTIFDILRTEGLLRQFKVLLKNILGALKIRDLEVDLTVGLDDPAETGLLFAFVGPASRLLSSSFPHQIRVQPSSEAVFEGYLHGTVRLQPIRLVTPILKFVFSSATIRAAKTLVVSKWKGKK